MTKERVRELRKNMTDAEQTLWKRLRLRQLEGYKFRRQQPIGNYIVDFVCLEKRIIIEVDGSQHAQQLSYDSNRSVWLEKEGYTILRFWNNEVLNETDGVLEVIIKSLGYC